MTTTLTRHEPINFEVDPYAPVAERITVICACSNTDGHGDGLVAFTADSYQHALEQHDDHARAEDPSWARPITWGTDSFDDYEEAL